MASLFIPVLMLAAGCWADHCAAWWQTGDTWWRPAWYAAAFLPVGLPVAREAWEELRKGEIFSEFTLMIIATAGAFCIGEFPEAVAVMLFYAVGEHFQDKAVDKARHDVQALIELRPDTVRTLRDNQTLTLRPEDVRPGDLIELNAGDRVPLDGKLTGHAAAEFDTSALTGESVPRTVEAGGAVSAGMITGTRAVTLEVTRAYGDSALARIMKMVEEAATRKAPAELFIRRFARIYTPTVIVLAALIAIIPPLSADFMGWSGAAWSDYVYRALVFLVVSCPCALVVSIPLSYFSGIGLASRRGILFKGGNYLDALARVDTVVFDKTGTLTRGEFSVAAVRPTPSFSADELSRLSAAAESRSSHPLARAIVAAQEKKGAGRLSPETVEELPGRGLRATIGGHMVLAGNARLLHENGVAKTDDGSNDDLNEVLCAIDGRYAGRIVLSDTPRPESAKAVARLRRLGIKRQAVLSGDRSAVVADLAQRIGIEEYHGDLWPDQKGECLRHLLADTPNGGGVAFVGDGINDAPALALSHVGIAMGGAGSDAAVETADVVIQSDNPAKVPEAIRIARATRRLAHWNITLAIGVKIIVLLLGLLGQTPLWAAVLADTGVALLCVLNVFTLPLLVRTAKD